LREEEKVVGNIVERAGVWYWRAADGIETRIEEGSVLGQAVRTERVRASAEQFLAAIYSALTGQEGESGLEALRKEIQRVEWAHGDLRVRCRDGTSFSLMAGERAPTVATGATAGAPSWAARPDAAARSEARLADSADSSLRAPPSIHDKTSLSTLAGALVIVAIVAGTLAVVMGTVMAEIAAALGLVGLMPEMVRWWRHRNKSRRRRRSKRSKQAAGKLLAK
jgi:hypothetical protein